jgi:hypothetical protein
MNCRLSWVAALACVPVSALLASALMAQSSGPAASPGSTQSAASGAFAIESQSIAYEAINEIALQLKTIGLKRIPRSNPFLLGTSANISAIVSYLSFKSAAQILEDAYARAEPPITEAPPPTPRT